MRNKNLIVLGVVLAAAALLFGVSQWLKPEVSVSPEAPKLELSTEEPERAEETPEPSAASALGPSAAPTVAPTDESSASVEPTGLAETAAPDESEEAAYLVVTVNGTVYEPILLTGEGSYTIRQPETGAENVVHVTKDSIYMESANCEGQDCIGQGVVSIGNRDERVLGNMIICLPNKVALELYTREEIAGLLTQSNGADD